jgi:hypothetical protein
MKSNFGPQWEPVDLKGWAQQAVELDDTPGLLDAIVATVRAVRDLRAILNELGVPHSCGMELVEGAFAGLYKN